MSVLKPLIGVINFSKKLSNDDVKTMVIACQNQLNEDVAPNWHLEPWFIIFYSDPKTISPRALPIVIFDSPDTSEVAGYHAERNGKPYECIFIEPILNNNGAILYNPIRPNNVTISTYLSHKIIETFIDQYSNKWVYGPKTSKGNLYACEACDPVQGHSYTKIIGDQTVSVSNFLLPSWFNIQNTNNCPTDFMNVSPGSFRPASNSYVIVKNNYGEVDKIFNKEKMVDWLLKLKTHYTSRTFRRFTQAEKTPWWKYLF